MSSRRSAADSETNIGLLERHAQEPGARTHPGMHELVTDVHARETLN
eukprot:CAMPEP_0183431418 /NCGR_PEP_ID=MMETSP0370-20130417/54805_1 /TAXON_ID=268820 /ORGANISM="Peridinium aciculiferum, Strain PAER-2" /LENGTH=46 /DNA_ID= /DNA_START= /DNA_END= /DNA_ORIENTATION=